MAYRSKANKKARWLSRRVRRKMAIASDMATGGRRNRGDDGDLLPQVLVVASVAMIEEVRVMVRYDWKWL